MLAYRSRVAVEHGVDKQARIFSPGSRDEGKLDILVNNAAMMSLPEPEGSWQKLIDAADLITVGLRSHFVASWHAAPLLIANARGLIVDTGHYGAVSYDNGPPYGTQKAGADKMAADMAHELRAQNIAAVSV
ncbi:SDR family NAD(P)-dependent oxidoreductase [Sphingomonas sp. DC2300-3]|uniref:SDR family NAD(P)-dependent oxidoreductase n=1 Tax=unclassified Sphingomonas TaxID=196159 RepID=UPI003CEF87C6